MMNNYYSIFLFTGKLSFHLFYVQVTTLMITYAYIYSNLRNVMEILIRIKAKIDYYLLALPSFFL